MLSAEDNLNCLVKFLEISEENVPMEHIIRGSLFAKNRDLDGNILLVFLCKEYVRGSIPTDLLRRCFLYWIERAFRESNGVMTVIFDMQGTGLNNVDLDYTRYIINTLKEYYPNSVNYILVYEMSWIFNGNFP